MSATVLYTPEVLGLAVDLAGFPLTDELSLRGEGRSKSCGSTIALGLDLTPAGTISRIGVRSQACAIGQASAAIFAKAAVGRTIAEIESTAAAVSAWLADEGGQPDWPGFGIIAAARDYPARHGAVMLPWVAAVQALSSVQEEG